MKRCTKCCQHLSLDNFSKNGSRLRSQCKSCRNIITREARRQDPEKYKESCRRSFMKNAKEYRRRELEKIRNNPVWRLRKQLRIRLYMALEQGSKAGSAVSDLGCSVEEFKRYLESKFKTGMTWDNWGRGRGKWNIDHIIPLYAFDLSDREQAKKACHFTNLQPLWSEENGQKGKAYF